MEKFNSESNAGAAVGVVMLLLLIKFYRVPVVVAVMMAMRCDDVVVNVIAALWVPLIYIIARLIFPCPKKP